MSVWQTVLTTIGTEFSDISNVEQATQIVVRLLVAAVLGGLLGYEREIKGKNAGLRTHMLVCIGSALFILVPQQAGATILDLSRVIQGMVAGIGFLAAGAIVLRSNQSGPNGLTTAAGLWFTTAIGISAGMGHEALAVLSALIALLVLTVIPWVSRRSRASK